MKVRKKTVCHTCRKRKLRCDGKHPACSQCLSSKRQCKGYPDLLFVPLVSKEPLEQRNSPAPPSSKLAQQPPSCVSPMLKSSLGLLRPTHAHWSTGSVTNPRDGSLLSPDSLARQQFAGCPVHPSLPAVTQATVFLILRNYVPYNELQHENIASSPQSPRICGVWVTALPELAVSATGPLGKCLGSAMTALALSITAYKTGQKLVQPIASSYEHSLRVLQYDLQRGGGIYKNEQIAAVMCLALLEVLSPIKPCSWLVHVDGVSELIRSSSPDAFSIGIQHKLFVGFRSLLVNMVNESDVGLIAWIYNLRGPTFQILKAFILRKSTFLADKDWTQKPFEYHHVAPLQSLLSPAANIPEVLEKFDALRDEPLDTALAAANERLAEFTRARESLEVWSCSFIAKSPLLLYWSQKPKDGSKCHHDLLWFPDVSTANSLTHLWSFQILCLSHIETLLVQFPELKLSHTAKLADTAELRSACIKLCIRVFQSMEFLLQKEFMLYGLLSTGFPLYTACRALELDAQGRAVLKTLDRTVIDRTNIQRIPFLSTASSIMKRSKNSLD